MNDQVPMAGSHRVEQHRLSPLKQYWLLFGVSLAIALLLVLFSFEELSRPLREHGWAGESKEFFGHIRSGAICLVSGVCPLASEAPSGERHITVSVGVVQIAGVIAITLLWFRAFLMPPLKFKLFALVPTIAYVIGMFNAYQPAVFVAALAGIFVAAAHYENLEKHATILEQARKALDKVNTSLNVVVGELGDVGADLRTVNADLKRLGTDLTQVGSDLKQVGKEMQLVGATLDDIVEKVVHIANSTQLRLSKAGVDLFLKKVYSSYTRATTVYGVVRNHMIDDIWWSLAEDAFSKNVGLGEVWKAYQTKGEIDSTKLDRAGSEETLTLFSALTQRENGGQLKSAHFVSEMPMPGSKEWENRKKLEPAKLFDDLLGLAWECLVLSRVRERLGLYEGVAEWISKPLCWAHATNNEVWQVIKRLEDEESSVMKTADLIAARDNSLAEDLSATIIEYTQAEIRSYLRRGIPAEEYLCAVLCYARQTDPGAALHSDDDTSEVEANITTCLGKLEMYAWLDRRGGEGEHPDSTLRKTRARICVAIFKEFMDMQWEKPVSFPNLPREPSSLFLAQEVL